MKIKENILYKAIKDEYNGLGFANQCDQSIDYKLYHALKKVLDWTNTPDFERRIAYTKKRNQQKSIEDKLKEIGYCHNYQLERSDLVEWIDSVNNLIKEINTDC